MCGATLQIYGNVKRAVCVTVALCVGILAWLTPRAGSAQRPQGEGLLVVSEKMIQHGDIIFQTSRSSQSKAIQFATKSRYSHVGIVYVIGGKYYVYEAVQPVKFSLLDAWIRRGEGFHYVIKRLKDKSLLTDGALAKMKEVAEKLRGRDYDLYFGWSDERIYCSELVWKIYNEALHVELGKLQTLGEFDLTSDVVKIKMKERYGDKIPLNEKVISPAAIFESDKLITVWEQ